MFAGLFLRNLQTAVFQVLAHNKYKQNKALQAALDKLRKKHSGLTLDQLLMEGGDDVMSLKRLADAEAADNAMEQRRRLGDAVIYGQTIQLMHNHSRKFVRVSSTSTSKIEPSNMKVDLHEHSVRNSWFRIMPRYKVRAEGDNVRLGDQVVLESVKTMGEYLHAGQGLIASDMPDAGCHEINLSVMQTSFTINPYAKPVTKPNVVYAGDVIQLFHKVGQPFLLVHVLLVYFQHARKA